MKLLETVHSKIDNTIKYVFLSRGKDIIEVAYINKNDGKEIICVPTQTSCNLKCKFCFLSDLNLNVRNLSAEEILAVISFVEIQACKTKDVLLVSFMGCGEPLYNRCGVVDAIKQLYSLYSREYTTVRFAIASLVPNVDLLGYFIRDIDNLNVQLKFHYSLHSPKDSVRKELMPNASTNVSLVLRNLNKYINLVPGLKVEMHYSLIDGVNDTREDAKLLSELVKPFPVKLLKLSEKQDSGLEGSVYAQQFRQWLDEEGVQNEYYEPPGADVGASCGQFLLDYYKKYGAI